jgi:peroxiredoxin
MKKIIAIMLFGPAFLLAQAQKNTTVKASIKDLSPDQWIYWYPLTDNLRKDSVQTVAGGFELSLDIPPGEGDAYVIRFGGPYVENSLELVYLDKGNVRIKGDGPLFKNAKVSGTKAVDDMSAYNAYIKNSPLLKDRDSLYKLANQLYTKKDTTAYAALQPRLEAIDSINNALTKEWILAHKSSPASAFLLSFHLGRLGLDQRAAILAQLSPPARENAPAKRIANSIRVDSLTGIGRTALDFTQDDTAGHPVALKDFRGKYVLVDFWASWCVPCRGENPNVLAAYNQYRHQNFTVLGVSLDQPAGKDKWLKAIHDDHLAWTQVSDLKWWSNAVAKQYDIQSIPSNLLIDPQGKIVAKDLHGDELQKELAKVLPPPSHDFSLSGTIQGQAPDRVQLYYTDSAGQNRLDSCSVTGGRFTFQGTVAEPSMVSLGATDAKTWNDPHIVHFFLEPGSMTINLPGDDYKKAVITGSPVEDEYQSLQQAEQPVYAEMKPLEPIYAAAGEALRAAMKAGKDDKLIDSLRYRAAAIHDQFDPYYKRLRDIQIGFAAAHPQSYVTLMSMRMLTNEMPLDSVRLFYDRMGPTLQQTEAGKAIAEDIRKLQAGSPGSPAADFTAKELNGSTFSLSALRGKYVLIDFWASWCVPCRKSMPHVRELYERYKGKGLEVLAVSDDDHDSTVWKKAVAKDGTGIWHNVLRGFDMDKRMKNLPNDKDISEKFGIHSLPTKILIDPQGTIIGRYDQGTDEEAAAMDKKLADLLDK